MCYISHKLVEVRTMDNFQNYGERYYILHDLKKSKVDKIVSTLNEKFPKSSVLDRNNPKDFNFDAVSSDEVWFVVKKYCSGCSNEDIADCVIAKREEEYRKITGRYAEKKIKFPRSRIKDIINLLEGGVK